MNANTIKSIKTTLDALAAIRIVVVSIGAYPDSGLDWQREGMEIAFRAFNQLEDGLENLNKELGV